MVGDEAHQFKSKSLISIMTKLADAKYRFGFTGTLDGSQTHKWVLEGLFGPVKKVVSSAQLMEEGTIANLNIDCVILRHTKQKRMSYQDEMDYLVSHQGRNQFITNLVGSLRGNTLVLFQYVEKHGEVLKELIDEKGENRKIFYIHGGVETDEREQVRAITEKCRGPVSAVHFDAH